jgi:hypothetical protein
MIKLTYRPTILVALGFFCFLFVWVYWPVLVRELRSDSHNAANSDMRIQEEQSKPSTNVSRKQLEFDTREKWLGNLNADLRNAGKNIQLSIEGNDHTTLRMTGEAVDDKMPLVFFSTEGLCEGLRLMRFKNVIFVSSRPVFDGAYSRNLDVVITCDMVSGAKAYNRLINPH